MAGRSETETMIVPVRLAHAVLEVADLEGAVRFYTATLGFSVSGRSSGEHGRIVFLYCGRHRGAYEHDLALFCPKRRGGRRRPGRFSHVAFRLRRPADVDAAAEALAGRGVPIVGGPRTHTVDGYRYLYFRDPDGNMIEFISPTRGVR